MNDASTPTPRRQREHNLKLESLLAAAGEIFAKKGFHNASMEDIAERAEYATGTLYRYFPSKEALYVGLLESRYAALIAEVKSRVAETDNPLDEMRAVIAAQIDAMRRDLSILQIFFGERMEAGNRSEKWLQIESLHQQFHEWLAEGFAKGQLAGVFLPGDPRLYVMAIQGMLSALLRDWVRSSETTTDIELQKNFLIEFSLRAICVNQTQTS